jgi:hypothetical protein
MGLLVCRYGMFGVQIWGFWCADMGNSWRLGVQIWDFQGLETKGIFLWCTDMGVFGVQLWGASSNALKIIRIFPMVYGYGKLALTPHN